MTDFLVLRFDAPLQSFGGAAVDQHRVCDEMPGRALVAGLLANALGWSHGDVVRIQRLQERLELGSRQDRVGERVVDFHTVDLGQPHLVEEGWTTRGRPSGREGGPAARKGTHIRWRHYLADAIYTVVVALRPADEEPGLDRLGEALRRPARPLFIGRKCALPAAPILQGRITAGSVREALGVVPRLERRRAAGAARLHAWWPAESQDAGDDGPTRLVPVFDDRDWANQVHAGRRFLRHGTVDPPGGDDVD